MSNKRPVSLSKLAGANCWPWRGRLSFRLRWDKAEGPALVADGRTCIAMMEDYELADVLAQVPASALVPGSYVALMRTINLLRGEGSNFTGVRVDDLRYAVFCMELALAGTEPLGDANRAALGRLRDAAGLEPATAAGADGTAP